MNTPKIYTDRDIRDDSPYDEGDTKFVLFSEWQAQRDRAEAAESRVREVNRGWFAVGEALLPGSVVVQSSDALNAVRTLLELVHDARHCLHDAGLTVQAAGFDNRLAPFAAASSTPATSPKP